MNKFLENFAGDYAVAEAVAALADDLRPVVSDTDVGLTLVDTLDSHVATGGILADGGTRF